MIYYILYFFIFIFSLIGFPYISVKLVNRYIPIKNKILQFITYFLVFIILFIISTYLVSITFTFRR